MHVHELNPKKTLWVLILFLIVIIIGFITMKKPLLNYQLSLQQTTKILNDTSNNYFYPYQLVNVLDHENKNVVLIDLRNKYAYGLGHIPGAKSISSFSLTQKENINLLKKYKKNGITVVLYADNQLDADGPWLFFRQIGFCNIKILLGGYDYYKAHKNNLAQTKEDNSYLKGFPRFDYAKVARSKTGTFSASQKTRKPVIFHRRKKVTVAAGGC